jgi:hypothetical protein
MRPGDGGISATTHAPRCSTVCGSLIAFEPESCVSVPQQGPSIRGTCSLSRVNPLHTIRILPAPLPIRVRPLFSRLIIRPGETSLASKNQIKMILSTEGTGSPDTPIKLAASFHAQTMTILCPSGSSEVSSTSLLELQEQNVKN